MYLIARSNPALKDKNWNTRMANAANVYRKLVKLLNIALNVVAQLSKYNKISYKTHFIYILNILFGFCIGTEYLLSLYGSYLFCLNI